MENKKDVLKTITIIILVLVIVGLFTVPEYLDKTYNEWYGEGYQNGINDGVIYLARQQTQTSNVTVVFNNELRSITMAALCQSIDGVQQ